MTDAPRRILTQPCPTRRPTSRPLPAGSAAALGARARRRAHLGFCAGVVTCLLAGPPIGPSVVVAQTPTSPERSADESIVMRWSSPAKASPPALTAWYEQAAPKLVTVEIAWAGLLHRMGGHRPARFDSQCLGLAASLEQLDEPALLPVPDPAVDLYVKRLLRHLHHAARACRAEELFNVVYRDGQEIGRINGNGWRSPEMSLLDIIQ